MASKPAGRSADAAGALSPRERDVVSLAAQGLTSNEIANALSLSRATIETHFRGAVRRLSAHNRAHAIALALTHGEIALPTATVASARRPEQSHSRATKPTRHGV